MANDRKRAKNRTPPKNNKYSKHEKFVKSIKPKINRKQKKKIKSTQLNNNRRYENVFRSNIYINQSNIELDTKILKTLNSSLNMISMYITSHRPVKVNILSNQDINLLRSKSISKDIQNLAKPFMNNFTVAHADGMFKRSLTFMLFRNNETSPTEIIYNLRAFKKMLKQSTQYLKGNQTAIQFVYYSNEITV